MEIGAVVREGRKAVGLTQQELADLAGLSRRTVIMLEQSCGRTTSFQTVSSVLALRLTGLPRGRSLGAQLTAGRTKKKLSQAELAIAAHLSIPTVRELEADRGSVASLSAVLHILAPNARRRRPPRATWSEAGDERLTPPEWLAAVEEAFGSISVDPCWHKCSFVNAERVIEADEDGLKTRWSGRLAFVNPPFSDSTAWIHRCKRALDDAEVDVIVALLPFRAETSGFHDCIYGRADLVIPRSKPRFYDSKQIRMSIAPFAAVFAIWNAKAEDVDLFADNIGASVIKKLLR